MLQWTPLLRFIEVTLLINVQVQKFLPNSFHRFAIALSACFAFTRRVEANLIIM